MHFNTIIVRPWPNSCSVLTMLPYLTLATNFGSFYDEMRSNWISCLLALLALRTYNEIDR